MSLNCLTIDFDLIKVYIPNFNANIEGSIEDQEYLSTEIAKFCYNKYHVLALDELFQAVRNYFIANSRLDLVEKLMNESGLYSYYGADGTGCYLPDLFIATRYADFETFATVLKDFENASETSNYDDLRVRKGPLPSFMREPWYLDLKSEKNYLIKNNDLTLFNWSEGNINPGNTRAGNVIDCNLLISLAKENKNTEILTILEKYRDCVFVAFYWCDDEEKYPDITKVLHTEEGGYIMAIPNKLVVNDINENREGYEQLLKNSTGYIIPCDEKIYVNVYLLE